MHVDFLKIASEFFVQEFFVARTQQVKITRKIFSHARCAQLFFFVIPVKV
jgi:hypothetical protein